MPLLILEQLKSSHKVRYFLLGIIAGIIAAGLVALYIFRKPESMTLRLPFAEVTYYPEYINSNSSGDSYSSIRLSQILLEVYFNHTRSFDYQNALGTIESMKFSDVEFVREKVEAQLLKNSWNPMEKLPTSAFEFGMSHDSYGYIFGRVDGNEIQYVRLPEPIFLVLDGQSKSIGFDESEFIRIVDIEEPDY